MRYITTTLTPKTLHYYLISIICLLIPPLVARRANPRQYLRPPLPYCYPAKADLHCRRNFYSVYALLEVAKDYIKGLVLGEIT
ncbi:hypothetical protein L249_6025 [Ophiocordyceps polyrhachis-furcata BCC 54312]|uniref:Uncharacterized protein n=1 Tax=Ophiocordyceps polyrhachis-furcata BCC 54312 TaxID=1330021 RepID=A0A367LIW6_9HYPO|nr:hypothetical protein L249_6025 [Ophiocordyceps polyrhachis-furcata BCC 54312]